MHQQNYFIEPGNSYTYTILASQITTNSRFEDMTPVDRNCSLPAESQQLNMFKEYSKSACEYECALKFAAQACGCLPWNLPNNTVAADKLPLCNQTNDCFDFALRNFSTLNCGCRSGKGLSWSTGLHE